MVHLIRPTYGMLLERLAALIKWKINPSLWQLSSGSLVLADLQDNCMHHRADF